MSPSNMTQIMRPPSRPNSQFSQASAQSQSPHNNNAFLGATGGQHSNDIPIPNNTFYHPVSTAKNNSQSSLMNRGDSTNPSIQHHVAFDTNVSTYSQPSVSLNSQPQSSATDSATSSQVQAASTTGGKSAGKRRHSQVHHTSTLSYEDVSNLANSCTTEQKIVWVSRQVLGSGGANAFQRATSAMQRIKRQRARALKQKEGTKDDGEENLKLDTLNARLAKRMLSETKQGLQFCNLMNRQIRQILEDIDPGNPVLAVRPPSIGYSLSSSSSVPSSPMSRTTTVGSPSIPKGMNSTNVPPSPSAARRKFKAAEPVGPVNNGSTLRKLRKRGSPVAANVELLKMVGDHDDNGKKLPKKELSYRCFEATRWRTLEVADYVAACIRDDLWILARGKYLLCVCREFQCICLLLTSFVFSPLVSCEKVERACNIQPNSWAI